MTTERDEEAENAYLEYSGDSGLTYEAFLAGVQFQKERYKNPTLWAYGQACKALEKAHFRIKELEAAIERIAKSDFRCVYEHVEMAREALKGIKDKE